jgi:hypothetical protein
VLLGCRGAGSASVLGFGLAPDDIHDAEAGRTLADIATVGMPRARRSWSGRCWVLWQQPGPLGAALSAVT